MTSAFFRMFVVAALTSPIELVPIANASNRSAEAERVHQRFVEERKDAVEALSRLITSESLAPDAPNWAGAYGDGLGLGMTIDVAPGNGATYTLWGCMGVSDLNVGVVEEARADRVRVKWERDPRHNSTIYCFGQRMPFVSDEFFVVDWGDEHFLIASGAMLAFCNAVNGAPDRVIHFPCRQGTRSHYQLGADPRRLHGTARSGLPHVPREFRAYLLASPLCGKVVSIEDAQQKTERTKPGGTVELRANVDIGREQGLLRGMIVWIQESRDPWAGEVVEVGPTESTVMFRGPRVGVNQLARAGKSISTRKLAD